MDNRTWRRMFSALWAFDVTSPDRYFTKHVQLVPSTDRKIAEGDLIIPGDISVALDHLYGFVHQERIDAVELQNGNAVKWQFRNSIHITFDKTLDDIFRLFLDWSAVETDDGGKLFNVSMAFRRLNAYADWLEREGSVLVDPPMNIGDIMKTLDLMKFSFSHDKHGRLVGWHAISDVDMAEYAKLSIEDKIRAFTWAIHYTMYDTQAQQNGIVQVLKLSGITFSRFLMDSKLNLIMEELALHCSTLNWCMTIVVGSSRWSTALLRIYKTFFPKTLGTRYHFYAHGYKELVQFLGEDCLVDGFDENIPTQSFRTTTIEKIEPIISPATRQTERNSGVTESIMKNIELVTGPEDFDERKRRKVF